MEKFLFWYFLGYIISSIFMTLTIFQEHSHYSSRSESMIILWWFFTYPIFCWIIIFNLIKEKF
jgi:hypothetical protein